MKKILIFVTFIFLISRVLSNVVTSQSKIVDSKLTNGNSGDNSKFDYNLPDEDLIIGKKFSPLNPQRKCDKYMLKTRLPRGFQFNEKSGSICGTPEDRGKFHFEVVCLADEKQLISKFDIEILPNHQRNLQTNSDFITYLQTCESSSSSFEVDMANWEKMKTNCSRIENLEITLKCEGESNTLQLLDGYEDGVISNVHFKIHTNNRPTIYGSLFGIVKNSTLYNVDIEFQNSYTYTGSGLFGIEIIDSVLNHVGIYTTYHLTLSNTGGILATTVSGNCQLYGLFVVGSEINVNMIKKVGLLIGENNGNTNISYSYVKLNTLTTSPFAVVGGFVYRNTMNLIISNSFIVIRQNINLSKSSFGGFVYSLSTDSNVKIQYCWTEYHFGETTSVNNFGGYFGSVDDSSIVKVSNSYVRLFFNNEFTGEKKSYLVSEITSSKTLIVENENSYLYVNYANCGNNDNLTPYFYSQEGLSVKGELLVYSNCVEFNPSKSLPQIIKKNDMEEVKDSLKNFESTSSGLLYYDGMVYYQGNSFIDNHKIFEIVDITSFNEPVKLTVADNKPLLFYPVNSIFHYFSWDMYYSINIQKNPIYTSESKEVTWSVGKCENRILTIPTYFDLPINECFDSPYPEINSTSVVVTLPDSKIISIPLILSIPQKILPDTNEEWYNLIFSGKNDVVLNKSYTIDMAKYNPDDMISEYGNVYFKSLTGEGENTMITLLFDTEESLRVFPIIRDCKISHIYFFINITNPAITIKDSIIGEIISSKLYDVHVILSETVKLEVSNNGIVASSIVDSTLIHVGVEFNDIEMTYTDSDIVSGLIASKIKGDNNIYGIFAKGNGINRKSSSKTDIVHFVGGLFGSVDNETTISYSFVDINTEQSSIIKSVEGLFFSRTLSPITIIKSFVLVRNNQNMNSQLQKLGTMIGESMESVTIRDSWIDVNEVKIVADSDKLWYGGLIASMTSPLYLQNSHMTMNKISAAYYANVSYVASFTNESPSVITNSYLHVKEGGSSITYNNNHLDVYGMLHVYFDIDANLPSNHYNISNLHQDSTIQLKPLNNFNKFLLDDPSSLYYEEMIYYNGSSIMDINNLFGDVDISFEDNKVKYSESVIHPVIVLSTSALTKKRSYKMETVLTFQPKPTYNENEIVEFTFGICRFDGVNLTEKLYINIKNCIEDENDKYYLNLTNPNFVLLNFTLIKPIPVEGNEEWYSLIYSGNDTIYLNKSITIYMDKYNIYDMMNEDVLYFESMVGQGDNTLITLHYDVSDSTAKQLTVFPITSLNHFQHLYFKIEVQRINNYDGDVNFIGGIFRSIESTELYDIHITFDDSVTVSSTDTNEGGIVGTRISNSTLFHVGIVFDTITLSMNNYNYSLFASEVFYINNLMGLFVKGNTINENQISNKPLLASVMIGSIESPTVISDSFIDVYDVVVNTKYTKLSMLCSVVNSNLTMERSYSLVRNGYDINILDGYLSGMVGYSYQLVVIRDSWVEMNFLTDNMPISSAAFILESRNVSIISHSHIIITNPFVCSMLGKLKSSIAIFNNTYIQLTSQDNGFFMYCHDVENSDFSSSSLSNIYGSIVISGSTLPDSVNTPQGVVKVDNREDILRQPYSYILGYYTADTHLYSSYLPFYDGNKINQTYYGFYSGDIMYDDNNNVLFNDSIKSIIIDTNIPQYTIYPASLESYYIQLIPHNSSINGITVLIESSNEGNCIDIPTESITISNVLPYSRIDLNKTECVLNDEALTVIKIVLKFMKENEEIQNETIKLNIINNDSRVLYFDTIPEEVIEGSDFTMQLQMPIAQEIDCKWNEENDGHAILEERAGPIIAYTPSSSANYYYTIKNDQQSTPNLTFNCSGKFIYPLTTDVLDLESKIRINVTDKENNTINVTLEYNEPPNKVTAYIALTSKPYEPVNFTYECDENISCSETEFQLTDTQPKIITITQLNNSFNFIRFDIMMNLTTEDENYKVFSPYNLSVLLENVTLESVYNYSVYDNIALERNLTLFFNLSNNEPVDDVVIKIVCPEKLICSEEVIILNSSQTSANMTVSQEEIEEGVVVNENLDITIDSEDHRFKRPTYKYPIIFHNYFYPKVEFEPSKLEFNPYNNKTLTYNVNMIGNPIYPINITIQKLDLFNLSTYFVTLNKDNNFKAEIEVKNNQENEKWTTLLRHTVDQDEESLSLYEIDKVVDYNISNLEFDTSDAPKVLIVNVSDYEGAIYVDFDMPCYVNDRYVQSGDNCDSLYEIEGLFGVFKPSCSWINNQTFKITYNIDLYDTYFTPKTNLTIKPNFIRKSHLGEKTTEGNYSLTYMAPMIESAEFIDGKTIDILFTKEYEDLEENTNCALFEGYETKFGINGKCSKENLTHMIISLGENFAISKDDELKLNTGYIKRIPNPVVLIKMTGFGTYTVVKSSRLPLLNPQMNVKPKVLACEVLNLTSTVTYTSDKSHPVNYQWNISNIDTNTQSFSNDSSQWIIPPYYLNNDTNYNIKLSVDSFLHDIESVNSTVFYSKEDFILMELEESKPTDELYLTSKTYRIYANVELKTCQDTITPITVEWKVIDSDGNNVVNNLKLFDDNKVLQIDKHSLKIGKYKIICNATSGDVKESQTLNIEVIYSSLQVTIDKNYYQLYNYSDDINITATVIDEDSRPNPRFTYSWKIGDNTYNTENSNIFSSAILNLTFEEGEYESEVTVNDKYERTASYKFIIKVEYVMFYVNIISNPEDKSTFAPTDIFKLTAVITPEDVDKTDMIYFWSFTDESIITPIISKNNTPTIYVSCENITSTEPQYLTLTISDGDFEVTVYYKFNVVDKSISIDVEGSSTDYTFPEEYTITAGDWRAINMQYRFAVMIDNEIVYLQSDFSDSQTYKGVLPIGNVKDQFKLNLVVFIKDEYGSITKSVSDNSIYSTGKYNNDINGLMSIYTASENNDTYYVKVSTLSTLLNFVCENDNQCRNDGKCINGYCNCTEEYYGEMCQNHIPIDGKTITKRKYKYSNETGCVETTYSICINEPQYGGKPCDVTVDVKPADISLCEINTNGTWSNWTEWSKCSGYCKTYNGDAVRGVKSRYRECLSTEKNVTCDGDIAEYQNCTVVCVSPPKLCPGQYITEGTGEVIGSECSNNGRCLRTNNNCGESDPNCHSICVCNSGYNGSACQYTTTQYNTLLEFKNSIAKSMNETIYQQSVIGSFELQSKALHSLITYPTNINEDDVKTINDLLFYIVSEVEKIVNNDSNTDTQDEIPNDLIINIIKTTSLIMDNEWNQQLLYVTNDSNSDNSNVTQAPTISPVPQYGKYYLDLYKQIGLMYTKSLYAPPLTITSSAVSVEFLKADESYIIDSERYVGDSTVSISSEKIREIKDSTVVITSWLDNPDSAEIVPDRNSNFLKIDVYSPNTRASKANSGSTPSVVYILQRLTRGADLRHIQCTPTNDTLNGEMKLVVAGIISNEGGSRYLVCAGTQLQNKFTSNRKDISPKINEVGELNEAALKIQFKGDYTFVLIVTCGILLIGIILIIAYKCYDYKEFARLEEWQSFSFMRFGYFVDDEDWETGREKDFTDQFIFNIRNHHSWLSPSCTTVKELTIVNRHQRVVILLCEVLTSCAVNAGLYATSDRNAGQLAFSMIASSLAMLPATIILPYLYKYANNYSSGTVKRKVRGIITWWKKLKGFFKRHAKNTLFYLQAGLITTDLAYDVLNAIFFVAFLCLLPSGYFSIVFAFLFVVFLLETSSLFVVVSDQKKCQISSLIIFNILLLIVYVVAIVIYCVLWNDTTSSTYSIWKTWTTTPGFDELLVYVETNLECCGYNTISDYNMTDCTRPIILAQGGFPSCRTRLHDTLNDWSGLYVTYFVIAAIVLLVKIVLLFAYISFKIEIVLPDLDATAESSIKPDDTTNNTTITANSMGTTTMNYSEVDPDGSMTLKIVLALRKSINLVRTKRKKEYLSWRRSRKMRAVMVILANFFMFCYVVIMTFVTLLYGLTYTKDQSQYWAISLLGSLLIAILIQEPTTVLVETAAEKGLTALDRDA